MSPNQQHPPAASAGVPLQMNSNGAMTTQYLNMQPQPTSNQVEINDIPTMMNGQPPASANYNIPRMSNWVAGQPIPPENNVQYQYPFPGLVARNDFAASMGQDSLLHAISPKSAAIPSDIANHIILPDATQAKQKKGKSSKKIKEPSAELPSAAKANQSRERNREHARSTRLRKKAYVQQLKEMADGLRAIQAEEILKRRRAVQKRMGDQKVRRVMIQTALAYHSSYESDPLKWAAIVEESFWFKQPVTPFRSFRRSEVEKVSTFDSHVL
jgi:hypothetical protein